MNLKIVDKFEKQIMKFWRKKVYQLKKKDHHFQKYFTNFKKVHAFKKKGTIKKLIPVLENVQQTGKNMFGIDGGAVREQGQLGGAAHGRGGDRKSDQ